MVRAVLLLFAVLLGFAAACRAQSGVYETQFPSNGQDPKLASSVELLQSVCPGHVETADKVRCQIPCPAFTGLPETGGWELTRVTRGHFLSPTSDDAVLNMTGCEPHVNNFGGSILLTRRPGRWDMLWYRSGVGTDTCHKLDLDTGRQILVCLEEYGAMGEISQMLAVTDLLAPKDQNSKNFVLVTDTMQTCGILPDNPEPLVRYYIERVEFLPGLRISVTARYGKQRISPGEVQPCRDALDGGNPPTPPPTKAYRAEFAFDGKTFQPVPGSAKLPQ